MREEGGGGVGTVRREENKANCFHGDGGRGVDL